MDLKSHKVSVTNFVDSDPKQTKLQSSTLPHEGYFGTNTA